MPAGVAAKLPEILKICERMSAEHDLTALLDLVAREAARLLHAERATIFLLDAGRQELWSKVALGSDEILRFDARLGIAGAVALSGRTVRTADAYNDARFYDGIDARTGYRTRSLVAVPLRRPDGEIRGVFEVLNKKGGAFTAPDEEVLQALATHAAAALETAQLVGDLQRDRVQLEQQNSQLWREVEGRFATQAIVGSSDRIQNLVRMMERIRDSAVTVLITGESGTGKELVARGIHYTSPRARQPFVALNCAALPETLLESELFGIEKGVATGVERRVGHFERATGGTLFLDEIGDLSLTAQAKILRALQERVIERLGGRQTIPVDVRVISATNRDLEGEIAKGRFREDLFYRLRVIHLHTPALRDIRQDIPLLASHFLDRCCREMGKEPLKFSAGAVRRLADAAWPGNVRQLENEVQRLAVCARRKVIGEEEVLEGAAAAPAGRPSEGNLPEAVADLERRLIEAALQECAHNQVQAAKKLGLSRQGLINKMKRYRIATVR
jgi:Nif-specific regulatory protein